MRGCLELNRMGLMRVVKRRGIVLVSVIFIAILIGMFMVSAHILNQSRFGGMRQTAENRLAEEAADPLRIVGRS